MVTSNSVMRGACAPLRLTLPDTHRVCRCGFDAHVFVLPIQTAQACKIDSGTTTGWLKATNCQIKTLA